MSYIQMILELPYPYRDGTITVHRVMTKEGMTAQLEIIHMTTDGPQVFTLPLTEREASLLGAALTVAVKK